MGQDGSPKVLDLGQLPKRIHQGITVVALPASPDDPADLPRTDSLEAIDKIVKGYDYLLAHSPYAADTIARLKDSGPIWIFYSPGFLWATDCFGRRGSDQVVLKSKTDQQVAETVCQEGR